MPADHSSRCSPRSQTAEEVKAEYQADAVAEPRVFPLSCVVQDYAWGKLGSNSEVAQLWSTGDPDREINPDKPYAELWMGSHPKGDALIVDNRITETTLGQWIAAHPECLGSGVREKFQDQLPFLFKVLSVRLALSIQAHPDKSPPEIEGPFSPVRFFIQQDSGDNGGCNHRSPMVDYGFASLEQESVTLVASSLSDCVECMACSDNTVRASLTPKYIDVQTLCEMLTYTVAPASSKLFQPTPFGIDPYAMLYNPPVPDFTVIKIELPLSVAQYRVAGLDSPSILLFVRGQATILGSREGLSLHPGSVLFISNNDSLVINVVDAPPLLMFRACCLL